MPDLRPGGKVSVSPVLDPVVAWLSRFALLSLVLFLVFGSAAFTAASLLTALCGIMHILVVACAFVDTLLIIGLAVGAISGSEDWTVLFK
jgi:hypothetical protein